MDLPGLGGFAARVGGGVLDLLAPARCAGCRRNGDVVSGLCASCRSELRSAPPIAWSITSAGGRVLPAVAAAAYEGNIRAMLLAYKEHRRHGLRRELGSALLVACVAALPPRLLENAAACPLCLVPVPSQAATVKARGHDAVRGLADVAAAELRRLGIRARASPALRHARTVADQAGLTIAARSANVAGALAVGRPAAVKDRAVLVVDDIVTTGATAVEAARALSAAGAVVLAVTAVAATPRRRPHSRPGGAREVATGLG